MDPKDMQQEPKDDDAGKETPPADSGAAAASTENDPKNDDAEADVKDKHGQPGINKERHDKEVAELNAEIAKLKAEAQEAAENKAKREEYEKKVADLEAKMADSDLAHKLELAGCKSIKAAKALLDDCDGDVSKLKSEHPFLFEESKPSGTTGKKSEGAASGPAKSIRDGLKMRKD